MVAIPEHAKEVPYTDGKVFITETGRVFSKATVKCGKELSNHVGSNGYYQVKLKFKGTVSTIEVHQLMCRAFYDTDYVEKGLVCLHQDDNKLNINLSNLSLGTYSENLQQAYDNGCR